MLSIVLEAIIMLIAMTIAARWVIRRFDVEPTFGSTISMGLVALAILLPAELAGVLWVRVISADEYLANLVTGPGLVSLLMFLLFAAMPTFVTRAGRNRAL
jgi:hypothetical protein